MDQSGVEVPPAVTWLSSVPSSAARKMALGLEKSGGRKESGAVRTRCSKSWLPAGDHASDEYVFPAAGSWKPAPSEAIVPKPGQYCQGRIQSGIGS